MTIREIMEQSPTMSECLDNLDRAVRTENRRQRDIIRKRADRAYVKAVGKTRDGKTIRPIRLPVT